MTYLDAAPPPPYGGRCWRPCGRISRGRTATRPATTRSARPPPARSRPPAGPSPTSSVPDPRRSPSPPAAPRATTSRSRGSPWPPRGRHVIVSAVEHPAVLESARWLAGSATTSPRSTVDADGRVARRCARRRPAPDTTLVSIRYANNEVGTIQPIAELAAIAHAHGVPFHTDAVQAAGWLDLDVGRLGVQALSLVRPQGRRAEGDRRALGGRRTPVEPLIHGGGQQRGRDPAPRTWPRRREWRALGWPGPPSPTPSGCDATPSSPGWSGACPGRPDGSPGRAAARPRLVRAARCQRRAVLLDLERHGVICSSGSACAAAATNPRTC